MRRISSLVAVVFLAGCPGSNGTDGGTGGGAATGGGSATGGGGGATGGGGTTGGGTTGGGGAVDSGVDAGTVDLTQFCRTFRTAACEQLVMCGQMSDRAQCELVLSRTGFSDECAASLAPRVDAGSVHVDAAKMATCVAALNQDCSVSVRDLGSFFAFVERDPACKGAVAGTRQINQTCGTTTECVDGAMCATDAGACPGLCVAAVSAGLLLTGSDQRCTSGTQLASDLSCQQVRTRTQACTTDAGVILPCGTADVCRADDAGTPRCLAGLPINSACDTSLGEPCGPGTYCRLPSDGGAGVCDTFGGVGATCVRSDFFPVNCKGDLRCEPSSDGGASFCRAPTRMINEACSFNDSNFCAADFYCASGSGGGGDTCQALRALNANCDATDSCVAGLACLGLGTPDGGHCAVRHAAGQSCFSGLDCEPGLECNGLGTCVAPCLP
ncbi:MAG: hypothetical protein U0228_07880 [Myxococcaceae bacterium]